MYLWQVVDDEGEALDVVVQKRHDHDATTGRVRPAAKSSLGTAGLFGSQDKRPTLVSSGPKLDPVHVVP